MLTRTAKERRPGSLGVAEAIVNEYNGKKKNSQYRLSLKQLYDNKIKVQFIEDDDNYLEEALTIDENVQETINTFFQEPVSNTPA